MRRLWGLWGLFFALLVAASAAALWWGLWPDVRTGQEGTAREATARDEIVQEVAAREEAGRAGDAGWPAIALEEVVGGLDRPIALVGGEGGPSST